MKLAFKNRIMLSMVTVLLFAIGTLAVFTYSLIKNDAEKRLSSAYSSSINQLSLQLSYIFKDLRQVANNTSSFNQPLCDLIKKYKNTDDPLEKVSLKSSINNLLSGNSINYTIAYNTILYTFDNSLFLSDSQELFYPYDVADFASEYWIKPERYTYDNLGWYDYTQMFDREMRGPFFYIVRTVNDTKSGNALGVMRTGFSSSYITYMLKDVLAPEQSVCIINENGKVIATNNADLTETTLSFFTQYPQTDTGNYYSDELNAYFISQIAGTPWYTIGIAPLSSLHVRTSTVSLSIIIAALLCFGIAFIISHYLSRYMTRNINTLISAVNQIKSGDFDVRLNMSGDDEIGILGETLKDMSSQLKELMQDIIDKGIEKREADIKFLRAQINPHFLHNTLKTITVLSELKRTDEINQIVVSLTAILKESIAWDSRMIPFNQEINLLKNYLNIMEIRYDYNFDFSIDINPFLTDALIPRLTLQPIIENSISHGMSLKESAPYFCIDVRADYLPEDRNYMYISIEDNGQGIDEKNLETIREMLKTEGYPQGQSVGLLNVAKRLEYYFEDVQILIDSVLDKETTIKIILRIKKGES